MLKVVPFFNKLAGWRDAILLEKEAAAFDVFCDFKILFL